MFLNLEKVYVLMLQRRVNEDDESEIRFLIHQSQAGAIIGRGGNKVKEMREVCSASLINIPCVSLHISYAFLLCSTLWVV